jgi:hypothetical protein
VFLHPYYRVHPSSYTITTNIITQCEGNILRDRIVTHCWNRMGETVHVNVALQVTPNLKISCCHRNSEKIFNIFVPLCETVAQIGLLESKKMRTSGNATDLKCWQSTSASQDHWLFKNVIVVKCHVQFGAPIAALISATCMIRLFILHCPSSSQQEYCHWR